MTRMLLLAGGLLAIADLVLLVRIGRLFGLGAVLGCLFLPGMLGGRLARRQGHRCLQQIHEQLAQSRMPSLKLAEGGVILAAGLLMLYPGPLSTLLGLLLLIPGPRRLVAEWMLARWQRRLSASPDGGADGVGASGPGAEADPRDVDGLKPVEGREVDSQPLPGERDA